MDLALLETYEPGLCDVDQLCGRMPVRNIEQLSAFWILEPHRTRFANPTVYEWIQLAATPILMWIPKEFESSEELTEFRERFVTQLHARGPFVAPYTSDRERPSRPFTMLAGTLRVAAQDLWQVLVEIGIPEVMLHTCVCG